MTTKVIVMCDESEPLSGYNACLEVDGLNKGGCLKVDNKISPKDVSDIVFSIPLPDIEV